MKHTKLIRLLYTRTVHTIYYPQQCACKQEAKQNMWTSLCTRVIRLSCSCGGGVAIMKEEMRGEKERASGSLNRRCLQRRREEVDKETMVC